MDALQMSWRSQHVEAHRLTTSQIESGAKPIVLSPETIDASKKARLTLHCTGIMRIHTMKPLRPQGIDAMIADDAKGFLKTLAQNSILRRTLQIGLAGGKDLLHQESQRFLVQNIAWTTPTKIASA